MTFGLISRFDDLIVSIGENFYEAMTAQGNGEEGKRVPFPLFPVSAFSSFPLGHANQVALKLAD